MGQQEVEYLRQHIHDLERSRRRWRTAAVVSWIALALFLLAGGVTTVTLGLFARQRMREEQIRALEAEMVVREEAERARQAEMEARQKIQALPNNKTGQNAGGVRQP